MTKRIEILKASLLKKEARFNERIQNHFDTVKLANGQPLNDKRNGRATMDKWDKQSDALRTLEESIQKTKDAIEREERKIQNVESAKEFIPAEIMELVDSGVLNQWRKHPHTFFVNGVEKGRIVWDKKSLVVCHKYYNQIPEPEQKAVFRAILNDLVAKLNKK